MNNISIRKTDLKSITRQDFRNAISLCFRDGITSIAPLGMSGDTIMIYGDNRVSEVSIRNYCGDPELLITDLGKAFLFYGRFNITLGLAFLVEQYWKIFNLLIDEINKTSKKPDFDNMKINPNYSRTSGFDMLNAYEKTQL